MALEVRFHHLSYLLQIQYNCRLKREICFLQPMRYTMEWLSDSSTQKAKNPKNLQVLQINENDISGCFSVHCAYTKSSKKLLKLTPEDNKYLSIFLIHTLPCFIVGGRGSNYYAAVIFIWKFKIGDGGQIKMTLWNFGNLERGGWGLRGN